MFAIQFLHDIGIAHRDLKMENVMISKKGCNDSVLQIKIIDFGLSKQFDPDDISTDKFTGLVGTPHYLAPEVLNQSYSEKCDIWAIGIIAYLLFSQGQYPFEGSNEVKLYKRI